MNKFSILLEEYLAAFVAANPNAKIPEVSYHNGWFTLGGTKHRRKEVLVFIKTLWSRVNTKETPKKKYKVQWTAEFETTVEVSATASQTTIEGCAYYESMAIFCPALPNIKMQGCWKVNKIVPIE